MDQVTTARGILHKLEAPEDVGAARRLVHALAVELGASDAELGRAELAITELGTNTLHHARPPGYLLVQSLLPPHGPGLELFAVDHGPGISDVSAVLDTTRTRPLATRPQPKGEPPRGLGCGLSSVKRLASEFDIYSLSGQGTIVLARFFFGARACSPSVRWGAVSLPIAGELQNGDAWSLACLPSGCAVVVVDGLGHGPAAARAAQAAVALFQREPAVDLERYLREAHVALRATRGAAISVCRISVDEDKLYFAGMGNVEGRIYLRTGDVGLAPRSGTIGMNIQPPKAQIRDLAWGPGATLVLHSDGVRQPSGLSRVTHYQRHDPALLAALLHRDFGRGRDDATVVVVQDTRAATG